MRLLRRRRREVGEREVELVRDAYRHTRAWEMQPVRELLASGVPGRPAEWHVFRGLVYSTSDKAGDLPRDLFGLSPNWQIDRFEIRQAISSRTAITMVGACHCRNRDTGEARKVPFLHVWRLRNGRVDRVESRLNNVELRRVL
jgi:hypothetical protein